MSDTPWDERDWKLWLTELENETAAGVAKASDQAMLIAAVRALHAERDELTQRQKSFAAAAHTIASFARNPQSAGALKGVLVAIAALKADGFLGDDS